MSVRKVALYSIALVGAGLCKPTAAVAAPPEVECSLADDSGSGVRASSLNSMNGIAPRVSPGSGRISTNAGTGEAVRAGIVAASATWPDGYIPYVFAVDDGPNCARMTQAFCPSEVEFFKELEIDSAGHPVPARRSLTSGVAESGAWWRFVEAAEAVEAVRLVDVSLISEAQRPAGPVVVRPGINGLSDWLGEVPELFPECDPAKNVTAGRIEIVITSATPGTWNLGISTTADSVLLPFTVTTGTSNEAAQELYEQLTDTDFFSDAAAWRIGLLESRIIMELREGGVQLVAGWAGPLPTGTDSEVRQFSPCINNCENPDCSLENGFRCSPLWDKADADYDITRGFCEPGGGRSSIGDRPDELSQSLELPHHWYTRALTSSFGHELGHTMGFIHEHQRSDFEAVREIIDDACLSVGEVDIISSSSEAVLLGLELENGDAVAGDIGIEARPGGFDYASQMMYSSNSRCSTAPECRNQCLGTSDLECPDSVCSRISTGEDLFYIKVGQWFEGEELFGKPADFYPEEPPRIPGTAIGGSYDDHDAYRWMYPYAFRRHFQISALNAQPECLADNSCLNSAATAACIFGGQECVPVWRGDEPADQFGSSLALLPFGDENMSLLVGAPTETIDFAVGGFAHGQVAIFDSRDWARVRSWYQVATHSPFQLMSDFDRVRSDATYTPESATGFGSAIAGADLFGDGVVELVIGKPDASGGSGVITLYERTNSKYRYTPVSPPGIDLGSDLSGATEFGAVLAAGDLDGDGSDELAVAAPGGTGRVVIYRIKDGFLQRDGFYPAFSVVGPLPPAGAELGRSVAMADLDGDGDAELIFGAPGYNNDSGFVDVRDCSTNPMTGNLSCTSIFTLDGTILGPGARLGESIAAGDFIAGQTDGRGDIAVGAPGYDNGRGIVLVLESRASGFVGPVLLQQSDLGEVNEDGDAFGAALAVVGSVDGRAPILAVGAPGESTPGFAGHGEVDLVAYSSTDGPITPDPRGRLRSNAELPCFAAPSSTVINSDCGIPLLPGLEAGAKFGAELTAREGTLAIGAPGWDSDTGRVFVGLRPRVNEPAYVTTPNDSSNEDSVLLMHWYSESDHGPRKLAVR